MSPLRKGRTQVATVTAEDLAMRVGALGQAVAEGGAELGPSRATTALVVVDKVGSRTALADAHTVVALAGATGSGKSSLFNALVGDDLATVGARRPTTSTTVAAVWGQEPATALLDWLGVGTRHHVEDEDEDADTGAAFRRPLVGSLDGLVLLDLPDFDSRVEAHRDEAERILDRVDLFVWVTDPQKYADARLHDGYLAVLREHELNTVIVLNQADRLTADQLSICRGDLTRLAERDGLQGPTVLPTSATQRTGIDELRQRLANLVAAQGVSRYRLMADVRSAATSLRADVVEDEPTLDASVEVQLVDALSAAAGVETVIAAVERDYRREAATRTGWVFTRWVARLRPDPLTRLRLTRSDLRDMSRAQVRQVLGRSSLPKATPAARAAVDLGTDRLVHATAAGLPTPWSRAIAAAAQPAGEDLVDALDHAVMRTSLRVRDPWWWLGVGIGQILLALAAVLGLLWLAVLAVVGWLQLPDIDSPRVGPFALPFLLCFGGLLGGLLLSALARPFVRVGSRRRGRLIAGRMRESISVVAEEHILAPVRAVLARHARTRELLDRARA